MYQSDMFYNGKEDYLYGEFQKTKSTVDKLRKSMHAEFAEIHSLIILLKEKLDHQEQSLLSDRAVQ